MKKNCLNGHQFNERLFPMGCPYCMPPDSIRNDRDNTHGGFYPAGGNDQKTIIENGPDNGTVHAGSARNQRIVGWVVVEPQRTSDFRLHYGMNVIGRGPEAKIRIDDPLVGSEHAIINYDGERFEIADHFSKNGTFLNDDPKCVTRTEIKHGDVIRIGDTTLKFIRYA